jgi:hypothetical protein
MPHGKLGKIVSQFFIQFGKRNCEIYHFGKNRPASKMLKFFKQSLIEQKLKR